MGNNVIISAQKIRNSGSRAAACADRAAECGQPAYPGFLVDGDEVGHDDGADKLLLALVIFLGVLDNGK